MYQESKYNTKSEEDFGILTKAFEEEVCSFVDSNPIEMDLELVYWNKVSYIGEECKILQKNDKICLVAFKHPSMNQDILKCIYRIEDLSIN